MTTELNNEEEWVVVPTFDGDYLQLWIKEMDEFMTRFQVPKIQMVNFAHVYVEGSARDWVRLNYDAVCGMNWPQFVDAIQAKFGQEVAAPDCVDEERKELASIDEIVSSMGLELGPTSVGENSVTHSSNYSVCSLYQNAIEIQQDVGTTCSGLDLTAVGYSPRSNSREASPAENIAYILQECCIGCAICIRKCPVEDIQIVTFPKYSDN